MSFKKVNKQDSVLKVTRRLVSWTKGQKNRGAKGPIMVPSMGLPISLSPKLNLTNPNGLVPWLLYSWNNGLAL